MAPLVRPLRHILFNVHLVATARTTSSASTVGRRPRAARLAADAAALGSAARALRLDFSVRSQMQPELLVELSRKLHTALSGGATSSVVMPPPPPRMPAAAPSALAASPSPAPPKAAGPPAAGPPPPPCQRRWRPRGGDGGCASWRGVDEDVKATRLSRGGADPRHRDHLWCSPDGRRFNSRVKVQRYLDSLAAAPAVKEEEEEEGSTWVQCERCEKWRELSGPPKLGGALGDAWFCEMNDDAARNSCDAPEQSWDDEEWTDDGSAAAKAAPAPAPEKPAAARRRGDTFGNRPTGGSRARARGRRRRGKRQRRRGGGVGVGAAGGADAAAARPRRWTVPCLSRRWRE